MVSLPRTMPDMHLAPVALPLDARIRELGTGEIFNATPATHSTLSNEAPTVEVGLASDRPNGTARPREAALLEAVLHLTDCPDRELAWDARGIQMSHGPHGLVLGVPGSLVAYVTANPKHPATA